MTRWDALEARAKAGTLPAPIAYEGRGYTMGNCDPNVTVPKLLDQARTAPGTWVEAAAEDVLAAIARACGVSA